MSFRVDDLKMVYILAAADQVRRVRLLIKRLLISMGNVAQFAGCI